MKFDKITDQVSGALGYEPKSREDYMVKWLCLSYFEFMADALYDPDSTITVSLPAFLAFHAYKSKLSLPHWWRTKYTKQKDKGEWAAIAVNVKDSTLYSSAKCLPHIVDKIDKAWFIKWIEVNFLWLIDPSDIDWFTWFNDSTPESYYDTFMQKVEAKIPNWRSIAYVLKDCWVPREMMHAFIEHIRNKYYGIKGRYVEPLPGQYHKARDISLELQEYAALAGFPYIPESDCAGLRIKRRLNRSRGT